MKQSIAEEMEDKHAFPSGGRFREFARDVEEVENSENFNSTELTETLGKLRIQGKSKQIDKMQILE